MASVLTFARAGRSCHPRINVVRQFPARREIHATSAVLKKKKGGGTAYDEDDIFSSQDDDLFGSSSALQADKQPETVSTTVQSTTAATKKNKLSPAERTALFNGTYSFVAERIGPHPVLKKFPEQVRHTALHRMIQLAATKEQMEQIIALLPKWRESRLRISETTVNVFVHRCRELRCTLLALQVFSDHPKYGMDLNPAAGRQLLHDLHVEHPLSESITLSALYSIYALPSISGDLISCALLTSACYKTATKESLVVARALTQSLQALLDKEDPKAYAYPVNHYERSQNKEKAWLTWTLTKIEKALEKHKQPYDWLRQWRERSGHVQVAL
ncbi:hypothetical protein EW026_g6775 [Hermanssonia centrifuga]|uniref:Uncharacterized protein n=1 Tax=Hermanssonia centrifuga TaxID=98765 RepID=A0A4S4KAV8_9APHY|nr:hypothetical protein EW026_g6775 [Hermanssonia centrifuga]